MKSQIDLIEQEFRILQAEFKKKNPQIKESFDNALKWIEQKKDQQSCQPKELLEPLQLIFESKIIKSYPAAMNSLQKIALAFSITDELLILSVIGMLRETSAEPIDEMTQIRVLQLLLAFFDPKNIVLSKELVNSALQCCFQMFETKQNAVRSTIQATLKTVLTLITDRFLADFRAQTVEEQFQVKQAGLIDKKVVYQVLHGLIQDIAFTMIMIEQSNQSSHKKSLSFKVPTIWKLKPGQNAKCVLLDLLNLILNQTKGLMVNFPEITTIFELQIVPTLDTMMQNKQISSLIGLRQMKCAILIIQNVNKGINLLSHILVEAETLAQKAKDGTLLLYPSWRNHIGFECLQIAIGSAQLTKNLAQMSFPNNQAPILLQILECYLKAAKAIETNQDKTSLTQSQEQTTQYVGTQKIAKLIDSQVIDGELASPSILQLERIIIESVCTFSDNFVHVFQAIGIKLGTQAGSNSRGQNFGEVDTQSEAQCRLLLQISWKPLLEAIQRLIKTNIDEASLQMLLRAYQSCIGACGSANCYEARDAFLISLCSQCVTSPQPPSMVTGSVKKTVNVQDFQLNERNILISKTVLNIAHCMCHILDVKSWFVILETMQKVEDIFKRKNNTQDIGFQSFNTIQLNFQELRQIVVQRMNDFNIVERSKNKGTAHHTRISSVVKQKVQQPSVFIQPLPVDEGNMEIQILVDSFNSLFTSSLLFDEQSLAELVCALAQLTVTKMQDAGSNQNHVSDFGLRRLVETSLVNICRIEIFWKIIVAHLEMLAQSKDPQIRQLTIEALQLLILEYFQYKKAEQTQALEALEDIEDSPREDSQEQTTDEQWVQDQWQYTIIQPLAEQLKLPLSQDKIIVLKCIEKIIQVCGQQIKNEGWRIIIVSVSKSLEVEADQVIACGFRCLKLIVSNYISKLSQPNFRTVLDAIHLFASNRGDNINSNLSAISMFQNVADFIARQIKSEAYTFKNTWLVVFERIKSLGQDHRAEVRRANIHTLENIVMTHGATFQGETDEDDSVWSFVFENVVLGMLQHAIQMFATSTKVDTSSANQSCQTPQFSTQKKINFEEASVAKALKQYDEHWEDTCSILAETACRAFKKFVMACQDGEKCGDFWDMLVGLLAELLSGNFSSMELCKTVFKSLSDLAPICSAVISQDSINLLLKATRQKIILEQSKCTDDKNSVLRLLKCVPILVESLQKISDQTELFIQNTENLYALLGQLTKCSSLHEGLFAFGQPNKLLSEEKVVFDFIESLCVPTIAYLEFLFEFFTYNKNDQRSEAFIRRALSIFYNCLLRGKLCKTSPLENSCELLIKMIPHIFAKITDILELRYDGDAAKIIIFQAKGQTTLFYTSGLYLILITGFLLNPDQFRARILSHQHLQNVQKLGDQRRAPSNSISSTTQQSITSSQEVGVGETGGVALVNQINDVLVQYPLMSADRSELTEDMLFSGLELPIMKAEEIQTDVYKSSPIKDLAWDLTQNKLLAALLFDPSKLKPSHFSQEVFKSSMDLEIQVINFIVNCLLPNSVDHQPMEEYEQHLIQIIDSGCQQLSSSNTSEILSKYCLNNLFELCKVATWQTAHDQIRIKIAQMATPILVNRCKQSLKKFITDEQKAGSVQLPRARVTEVCFTLRKLQELESADKKHLLQLMSTFAELIVSNEQQLKEILRTIFVDIAEVVNNNKTVSQNRCSSGGANF